MKKLIVFLVILTTINVIYAHENCLNNSCFCTEEKSPTSTNYSLLVASPLEENCDVSLSLETNKLVYKNDEKIEIYNKLSNKTHEFKIGYWIEGQNNTIIKEKHETENTNKKQFTPKLKESQNITIKNNLTLINCININNQTYNELSIFIEVEKDPNPSIKLEKLYIKKNKKIELGNNLTATILIYTGNLSNITTHTYIENITNKTEFIINNKFNTILFNTTLEIPNDCNITTQEQPFIIESIGTIKQNITIINNCKKEIYQNFTEYSLIENFTDENIINLASSPETGYMIYESKSIKAKETATYLGMTVLVIITIIMLITNKNTDKIITKSTEKWSSQLEQQ